MLRSSLKGLISDFSKAETETGINFTKRAEDLDYESLYCLLTAFKNLWLPPLPFEIRCIIFQKHALPDKRW